MALYFFAGVLAGLVFGFLPGMHSNTIISILAAYSIAPGDFSLFIIGLLPAHIIASFVPSIFFGLPEQRSVVATLAGQRMLLMGQGINALKVVLFSCIIASLFSVALFPFVLDFLPWAYSLARPWMLHIIAVFSVLFLMRNKNPLYSLAFFVSSGALGYYSLNSGMQDPFLPLFSGMFAMGSMLTYKKQKIPKQEDSAVSTSFVKFAFLGTVAGMLADLVPGISSPSMVSAFVSIFVPLGATDFLASVSSIVVSEAIFSFATSATINKPRLGATAKLAELFSVGENLPMLLFGFLAAIAISATVVFLIRKKLGKISSLDFSFVNKVLAAYLLFVVFVIDGFGGILVFALASALGFIAVKSGAERTSLMGSVILPTMILLAGITN